MKVQLAGQAHLVGVLVHQRVLASGKLFELLMLEIKLALGLTSDVDPQRRQLRVGHEPLLRVVGEGQLRNPNSVPVSLVESIENPVTGWLLQIHEGKPPVEPYHSEQLVSVLVLQGHHDTEVAFR